MTSEEALALLAGADAAVWAAAQPILETLQKAGHDTWFVGGVVRDLLLGRRSSGDPDLATSATPEEVTALFPKAIPTGIRHGTVTVMEGTVPVEITTFRVDLGYTDARHPDQVSFVRSIEEDLVRRDFTINAMAWDPVARRFLDPAGGLADLDAGLVRAVGDPAARFREDGLRPFRAVRFAAVLGFDLEAATAAAIPGALPQAARVAPERVREELNSVLAADKPSIGLELMRETGLMTLVLPELLEGYGMRQNKWHAFDVYRHILAVVDEAPADKPRVRLAALLHDIGKPRTKVDVLGEGTFYNHQHVGAAMARDILSRLRYSREIVDSVSHLVDQHMFHYEEEWTDAAVRRFLKRVGPEFVADLFDLRLADSLGNGLRPQFSDHLDRLKTRVESELAAGSALTVRDLALNGADVMNLLQVGPGPRVGEALEYLLDRVLEDPTQNERDRLLHLLKSEFPEKY